MRASTNSGAGLKKKKKKKTFLSFTEMKQRQDNNVATIQVRKEQWVNCFYLFTDFSITLFPLVGVEVVRVMIAVPPKP